jgi:hypothetical protein
MREQKKTQKEWAHDRELLEAQEEKISELEQIIEQQYDEL